MKETEYFYNLTPDVILLAVEELGLEPSGHVNVLNSYENRVYDLKLEDDSHIITKFYRPGRWTREQIQEEHEFLLELQAEEVPVCAPLVFDGETIFETESIFYTVWPRTGGRSADEFRDNDLEILGRALARIHNIGAAKKAEHRLQLNADTYIHEPLAYLLDTNSLPDSVANEYEATANTIANIYSDLAKDTELQRIHGDCHLGNLLHGGHGWFFLDFDDFVTGPVVQDLWMLLPARDEEGLRQRQIFLHGYEQLRPFDYNQLRLIEPLRALRYVHYSAWLARRWADPAFPHAFPFFGDDEYWQKELRDLTDQLTFIRQDLAQTGVAGYTDFNRAPTEGEGLSNQDYFWDMD